MAASVIVERYLSKGKRTHYRIERGLRGYPANEFQLECVAAQKT
jgi:hypothetical protein